jgi:hypothetical protein
MAWPMMDPLLQLAATGFTLIVLARAVIEKVLGYDVHVANLRDYRLLPDSVAPAAAAALLAAETAAIAALLVPASNSLGAALAVVLLAIYATAMAAVLISGRHEIECGCGGDGQLVSWALVGRNGVLVAIAGSLLLPGSNRVLHWPDMLVGLVAALVGALLLAIAEKAIGTSAAIRRLNSHSQG